IAAGTRILRGSPVHEETVEVEVLADHLQVGADGGTHPRTQFGGLPQFFPHPLHERVDVPLREGTVEAALIAEVAVQDGFADSRLSRDRGHGGIRTFTLDDSVSSIQDRATPTGVAAAGGASTPRSHRGQWIRVHSLTR